jgi:hypothetical protein
MKHLQSTLAVVNIGYATPESDETRVLLLEAMVQKLKTRCVDSKIYVSAKCDASKTINET